MRQIMTAIVVKQRQARARLFGDVRVFSDAGLPLEIGSRRARAMLGYLSMTPERAATRSRLCGLFWGERGEIQARASLRQCLREIRGATEHLDLALIGSDGERVVLVPGVLDTDVHELSSAFETEDATAARQILETIGTARLMEGLELEGSFREWLDQARARTEHVLSSGILALLKSLEARADWQTAQSLADTYLTRDPFDEAVVAMAIRADAALGNNASARRRFRNLEEALNREFRVRPGASARDAIAALSREGEASAREPDTASFEGSAALSAGPPTVVVAGFVSDGDSPADQKLTAILRDEILAGLAHFHDLRVVAEPRSLNEMAQDLHARPTSAYALGGTLRSFGESRRLTVQLLRGGAGELVWSRRYELPRLEFIGAIDEIIAPVVAAVVPTITSDMNRSPPSETADQAYERHLLTLGPDAKARDYEQARAAAASLEAMISADPSFARPYLPLSYLYNTDFGHSRALSSGPAQHARALDLAKVALALDRKNAHAYTAAGWCYLRRRRWDAANGYFEQALALNPYHVRRMMEVGFGLLFLGDVERARKMLDRCLLINPAPTDGFFNDLALTSIVQGEFELALSYLELTAKPKIWGNLYGLVCAELTGQETGERRDIFLDQVRHIWPPEISMTTDTLVDWIETHHPFQDPAVGSRLFNSVRRALREP
jgi:DNA-binding SARP family transcriptional activator/TolB-like protein/Tfp pilus assembly protein PilF